MLPITDAHEHIGLAVGGFITGGGLVRFLAYVSKAVPPLPKDAGWWAQFGYGLLKNTTGLDPNTSSLKAYDGTTDRRAAAPQA